MCFIFVLERVCMCVCVCVQTHTLRKQEARDDWVYVYMHICINDVEINCGFSLLTAQKNSYQTAIAISLLNMTV